MEMVKPDKDMIKTLDEVLAQNRLILEMNKIVTNAMCYPALVVDYETEGRKAGHNIRPGEVIYK